MNFHGYFAPGLHAIVCVHQEQAEPVSFRDCFKRAASVASHWAYAMRN